MINLFSKHLTQGLSTLESQVGFLSKKTKQQQQMAGRRGHDKMKHLLFCWVLFLECPLSSFMSLGGGKYLNTLYRNIWSGRGKSYYQVFSWQDYRKSCHHIILFLVRGYRNKIILEFPKMSITFYYYTNCQW